MALSLTKANFMNINTKQDCKIKTDSENSCILQYKCNEFQFCLFLMAYQPSWII